MNRSDLISRLKDNIDIKRQDAEKIVDTFFDALKETLQKNTLFQGRQKTKENSGFINVMGG